MTKKERFELGRLILWLYQISQSDAVLVGVNEEIKGAMEAGARQLTRCLGRHYKMPKGKPKKIKRKKD